MYTYVCICMYMIHMHRSAKTGDIRDIDHRITMQCSAGEPLVLAIMWMLSGHQHNYCSRPNTPPISLALPNSSGLPQQDRTPCYSTKLLSNNSINTTKSPRCWPSRQFPHISIWSTIHEMYLNKPDPRRPCHRITTDHPKMWCVHGLMSQDCCGNTRGRCTFY